ncbi:calcium-binding protein P-like, partial [Argonauta hians]
LFVTTVIIVGVLAKMADVVKSGWIQRYSKSFLDGGWRKVWVVLHSDSVMMWYKKQTDSESKGQILLKEVCKWFSVGQYTNGMSDQPDLPDGGKLEHVLAIPVKPSSRAKVIWFLFSSDNELNEWMNAIVGVLPPAPRKSHQSAAAVSAPYPTVQPTAATTVSAGAPYPVATAPPSYAPGAPPSAPPAYGTPGYPQQVAAYPRQAAPYPQQAAGYPQQQAAYPGYPQQRPAYPQQAYYPQQPAYGQARPPPPPGYAGAYQGYYQQPGAYHHQQQQQPTQHHHHHHTEVVINEDRGPDYGDIALGMAGGALLAHGATSMMGGYGYGCGGWGGGWGLGRWGSWSSLSSMSSFGSCGSFSSWGSFD